MTTLVYGGLSYRDPWTKIDNSVLTNRNISDGAARLYMYLAGYNPAKPINDNYLLLAMNTSKATLARRKAELYAEDLISTVQLAPRVHIIFVGTSGNPASKVAREWERTL